MGKGFKLPGKLPGAPVKVAMPAIQSGGSYRNPAMIIDRSAEILGAGIQSGMDKIGDALKQKAMDKMAEEKGQEPKSNVDKELNKAEGKKTYEDKSQAILESGVVIDTEEFPEFDTVNAKGLNRSFFGPPMVDDELAAVGAPVDLPETPLQMKNDSPNKFLGGAMRAAFGGGGSGGGGGQVDLQSIAQGGGGISGIFGRALQATQAQQAAGATQDQQAALASLPGGAAANSTAVGGASGGQTLNCTPVAMSYDPPLQANEKGGKTPVFNLATQGMAETAFGTPAMRQAAVGAAFQMTQAQEDAFGPGGHSENPGLYKNLK